MTNEILAIKFQNGDESVFEKLYNKNKAFIRSIAIDVASSFNCYKTINDSKKMTDYTKNLLAELQCVGDLAFYSVLKSGKYNPEQAQLTTYIYPFIKGEMFRFMESNIGVLSLSADEMDKIWKSQKMYFVEEKSYDDIAKALHISRENVISYVSYNTHFLSVYELLPEDSEDDPFDLISNYDESTSPDKIVYRKICIELFKELFDDLSSKDKAIIGESYGVFGYSKTKLEHIAIKERMKIDGVVKARTAAIERLKKKYPESKLYLWRKIYWAVTEEAAKGPM